MKYRVQNEKELLFPVHQDDDIADENRVAEPQQNQAFSKSQQLPLILVQAVLTRLSNYNFLGTDKFGFITWFSIFEEHFNYFPQIIAKFIERFGLGMCAGKSWNISNI